MVRHGGSREDAWVERLRDEFGNSGCFLKPSNLGRPIRKHHFLEKSTGGQNLPYEERDWVGKAAGDNIACRSISRKEHEANQWQNGHVELMISDKSFQLVHEGKGLPGLFP